MTARLLLMQVIFGMLRLCNWLHVTSQCPEHLHISDHLHPYLTLTFDAGKITVTVFHLQTYCPARKARCSSKPSMLVTTQ